MNVDPIIETTKNISNIAPQAYDDVVHPPAKNAGKALGTITGLVNTILTPIEVLNETIAIKKEKFLEEYKKNLDKIPSEKQCPPDFEVAAPIIDHLKFKITEDTLRKKYAKLLSEASNSDSLSKPLLAFDNVLTQLTPYEIELLTQLFGKIQGQNYALASIKVTTRNGYQFLYKNIPDISFKNFSYEIISVMISNFERLGLVSINYMDFLHSDEAYNYIYKSSLFTRLKEQYENQREQTHLPYPDCDIDKLSYSLTEFGKSFVSTVII